LSHLQKLEREYGQQAESKTAVVITPIDSAGELQPIYGFAEFATADPIEVWREPDETDDQLQARALEAVKAKPARDRSAVPMLVAINTPEEMQK